MVEDPIAELLAEAERLDSTLPMIMEIISTDWASLSPGNKRKLYNIGKMMSSAAKAISDSCKSDLTDGLPVTGLYLASSEAVSGMDVCAAKSTLTGTFGFSDSDVLNMCTIPIALLRKKVFERRALDEPALTEKENAAYVDGLVAPFVFKTTRTTIREKRDV